MFEVGKQVVCIDGGDGRWPTRHSSQLFAGPKTGQVLTVSDIRKFKLAGQSALGLQFFEITVPTPYGDAYFNSAFFRPVKETSIEVFTKIIKSEPVFS